MKLSIRSLPEPRIKGDKLKNLDFLKGKLAGDPFHPSGTDIPKGLLP
jgi:hypothetical protein